MSWQSLSPTKPSTIDSAAALADLHPLATNVGSVLVHPFMFGVGEGVGESDRPKVLSFTNAVEFLAFKLAELKPAKATCVAFADTSLKGLNSKLKAAIDATGMHWLLTPQQRSELLNTIDKDKFTLVPASAAQLPVRQTHTVLHVGKIAECYHAKSQQLAKLEAVDAVADIATELANFDSKKQTHDSDADAALSNVELGSASGYVLQLSGGNIAGQLRDAGGPGAELTLTVILCFWGEGDDLALIDELVGA